MSPELTQVVARRGAAPPAPPALFQIKQGNLYTGRLAFTRHTQKNVLGITATVLPARPVDAAQGNPHGGQHMLMKRHAVARGPTVPVPVFQADETFQFQGDQQGLPLPGLLPCTAVNHLRHAHACCAESLQRTLFTQHGGLTEGMGERAIQVADLPFAIQQWQPRITQLHALHAAFP